MNPGALKNDSVLRRERMPEAKKGASSPEAKEGAASWRLQARKLKDRADHDGLLNLAKERLQKQPGDPLASAYLGYALAARGEREIALAALAKATGEPTERIQVMLLRTRLLHELEREAEAIQVLDIALADAPRDPTTIRAVIQAHIAANRPLAAIKIAHQLVEVSPDDVASWRALCETAMGVGHYAEAVEAAGKVLAMDPDDSVVARYQALSLLRLGYTDQAAKELEGHLQSHPSDQEGWHDLGLIQASTGQSRESIASFQKACELEPDDALSCQALGTALARAGEYAQAREVLRKATQLEGSRAETWFNLGVVLEKLGEDDKALTAYERAQELEEGYLEAPPEDGTPLPLHLPSAINRGITLARLGRLDEARAQLEKALASDGHNISILYNLANIYFLQGEYQTSYATFRRLLHHDPFDVEGWKLRGESLALSLGIDGSQIEQWMAKGDELFAQRAYVEAHECFRRAMDLEPNNPRARARRAETLAAVYQVHPGDPGAWLRTARMLMELRLLSDAVDALSILFTMRPQDPDGRVLVGRILFSLQRYPLAAKQADLALRSDPRHPGALVLKGEALLGEGRPMESVAAFDALLEQNPNDPMVLTLKGIALCQLQQGEKGLRLFDDAIRLDPKHREAWYQKGVELEREGRYASAVEAFVQGFQ